MVKGGNNREIQSLYLFNDIESGLFKSKHQLMFVSLSNRRINDDYLRKQFVQLDTNLKTFDSLIWKFLV